MADLSRINNTLGKMAYYLRRYNSISVGVSGGSDSDIIVHIISTYFRELLHKVRFVFIDTGMEYQATRRHLKELESKYRIHIEIVKGKSVVLAVREYGIPVISKDFSGLMKGAVEGKPWALYRVERTREESPYALSKKKKEVARYIIDNNVKVSDACCRKSKKEPFKKFNRQIGADLLITGERLAEGGVRAAAHKSCFEEHCDGVAKYMPLWFWDDETKQYYKDAEGVIYSDCYEVWGMKRTGCVGCPFNSLVYDDLEKIKKYEPNMYKACLSVFGESYRIMDMFSVRKKKILPADRA